MTGVGLRDRVVCMGHGDALHDGGVVMHNLEPVRVMFVLVVNLQEPAKRVYSGVTDDYEPQLGHANSRRRPRTWA